MITLKFVFTGSQNINLSFFADVDEVSEYSIRYVLSGSDTTGPSLYSTLIRNYLNCCLSFTTNFKMDVCCKIYDLNNNLRFHVKHFYKYISKFDYIVYKGR